MPYISTTWFGVFLHDGRRILKKKLFPKDPERICGILKEISSGKVLEEEVELAKGEDVSTREERLSGIAKYSKNVPHLDIEPTDFGFDHDLLREALIMLSKDKVEEELCREDLQVIQLIKGLKELRKISNLLMERIAEWKNIPAHEGVESLEELLKDVEKVSDGLKKRLEEKMHAIAPNLCSLIGPTLGAELIALAGGLEKLAKLPASSIQILGAEKALFRYKQGIGTPPKHGIIFRHHLVRSLRTKKRGKMARFLANKISMAVRADVFTKKRIDDELGREVEEMYRSLKRD